MTTGNYEQRLATLRTQIDTAKSDKARAEAQLQMIDQRQREICTELEALGVTPEDLDATIQALRDDLEANLAAAEGLIPDEMRRQA